MRRFDYFTFEPGTGIYKAEFSATLDIVPQKKLNSAIAEHAIQNGIIFSLLPYWKEVTNKNGIISMKRFITNIGLNFWASGNYTLKNNFYFHLKCLEWTLHYLHNRFGKDAIKYLVGYTDGCPDQYKSRLWALMVGLLCDMFDLEEYLHEFAHTACFKTNIDSFCSDTKTYVKMGELRELFRLINAESVWNECKNECK
jgi:hypothetical protein